jgi:hypothetical protein
MPKGLRKPMDEMLLGTEGGKGGVGGGYARARLESMTPKERAALETPGKHKGKKEPPNLFEMTDAERAALTPAQLRKYGSDATFKKGGKVSASKRADGIAQRGKTKGRMI